MAKIQVINYDENGKEIKKKKNHKSKNNLKSDSESLSFAFWDQMMRSNCCPGYTQRSIH